MEKNKNNSTKILKIHENSHYGQAMTKLLPYGCIKRQEHPPSLVEFIKILDRISHEDKIGHLFVDNIKFYDKNPKTLLLNEIYPPIFQKNKKMEPFERSTLQLMSILQRHKDKDTINSFTCTSKTQRYKGDNSFHVRKLLIFVKLSLKSFIYEITETFFFPKKTSNKEYGIIKSTGSRGWKFFMC